MNTGYSFCIGCLNNHIIPYTFQIQFDKLNMFLLWYSPQQISYKCQQPTSVCQCVFGKYKKLYDH